MNSMTKLPVNVGSIHFVGIGGIGMSGIAEVLLNLNYQIQGSDLKKSPITERLENLGIKIFYKHAVDNLRNASVVVISSAVKESNPELVAARNSGLPIVKRSEMLAELMRLNSNIAIAGTHGKTTTTTLVATLLDGGGLDPTVINGGIIHAYGSNARLGGGDWMVVEADENLHENIITEVIDGTLKIWTKKSIWRATSKKVHLKVTNLEELTASSGSSIISKNTIKAEDFEVNSNSGANLNMKLETNRVVSNASSGSKLGLEILATHVESSSSSGSSINIIGETTAHKASASSGSSLNAFGLKAKNVNAEVSSGASVRVHVTESFNARASSGGRIRYQGNPTQVSKDTSSGGGVTSD